MKIEDLNIGDKVRINIDTGIGLNHGEIEFETFLFIRSGAIGMVSAINNPFGKSVVEIIVPIKENIELTIKMFPEDVEKI
jgi:hypothetical protein